MPATAAPTPTARDAADVISLYSDAYTDVASNFDAGWCGSNSVSEITVAGNATMAYAGNPCQGIVLDASVDVSTFTNYNVDIFIEPGTDLVGKVFNLKFVGTPNTIFKEVLHDLNALQPSVGEWVSLTGSLDFSDVDMSGFKEFGITTGLANTVYYDNLYFYIDDTASVKDISFYNIDVYPNPASNVINFRSESTIDNLSVLDLMGRTVKEQISNNKEFSLDVSDLAKGVYLVKVTSGEKEAITKFIKE